SRAEWDHQISAAQLFVLREVGAAGRQSVDDIARRTVASAMSVSQVLTRLKLHGLVRAETPGEAGDAAEFTLTDAGQHVVALTSATVQERMVAGFLALPAADQERLAALLGSWVHLSALDDVPPTMFLEPLLNERVGGSA
ncbi:MAG: MarR family transcriptional regulator, partial [Gemmatimonadota bacterium]